MRETYRGQGTNYITSLRQRSLRSQGLVNVLTGVDAGIKMPGKRLNEAAETATSKRRCRKSGSCSDGVWFKRPTGICRLQSHWTFPSNALNAQTAIDI